MIPQKISAAIKRSMHDCIGYIGLGRNRILLHTGHFFPDGDEFRTVLEYKEEGGEYELILTDDGHTAMLLSYGGFEITDSRMDVLRSILNASGAELDGENDLYKAREYIDFLIRSLNREPILRDEDDEEARWDDEEAWTCWACLNNRNLDRVVTRTYKE